jgi:hypothetical protein
MIASLVFDHTGSYDGFMVVMSLILLASGLLLLRESNSDRITLRASSVVSSTS